jgi:Ca2+-binding EF-hand superfamily protein
MKKTTTLVALATLLGSCAFVAAQEASEAPAAGGDKGGEHREAHGDRGQRAERAMSPELLKEFDKDGDGKIGEDERPAMHEAMKARGEARMLKEFDKDGDGKLSDTEREAAKARGEEMRKKMLDRFDADKDGQLSDDERAAMRKEMGAEGWGGRERGPRGEGRGRGEGKPQGGEPKPE